jgi:hypothetical protein
MFDTSEISLSIKSGSTELLISFVVTFSVTILFSLKRVLSNGIERYIDNPFNRA